MVAKFKTLYFNARYSDEDETKVILWTYKNPSWLKSFVRSYDEECLLCFCREVDKKELDKLLLVGFSAVWQNIEFKCEYLPVKKMIRIYTDNMQLAHEYAFTEKDGVYSKVVTLAECESLIVSEYDTLSGEKTIIKVDDEYFIGLWRLYVSNLSYGKKRDKDLVKAFI